MPSKTEALCAAIVARLPALLQSQLSVGYGARELDRAARLPILVWRLLAATHAKAQRSTPPPRPLIDRQVEIEAHLWAATDADVEALLEAILQAARLVCAGFQPGREDWLAETDERRAHNRQGSYCLLTFSALVTVTDAPPVLAHVEDVTFDTSISSPTDGRLDAGESP